MPAPADARLGKLERLLDEAAVLRRNGSLEEAERRYRAALRLRPNAAAVLLLLGTLLAEQARDKEAAQALQRSLAFDPDLPDSHYNLGVVQQRLGRTEDAVASFARAAALDPSYAEAHNNLGNALQSLGRPEEALPHYERALAAAPGFGAALGNRANALKALGRIEDAVADYRRALALDPGLADVHSNLLLALNYLGELAPAACFEEHRAWAQRHADPLCPAAPAWANDATADRRLRVGYVSPDFREHSVACFIEPILGAHDPDAVEVHCYADAARADRVTERLRRLPVQWHDIAGTSDAQVAELVRAHRIDILVDLAGHTAGNRLLAFARRPAPVQMTWIGYPNTTGMRAMDYRLTDADADPEGAAERLHTEALLRLPRGFLCYRPPAESPAVGPLPCLATGRVTYASFNNHAKLSAPTIACWAELLRAAPEARLLLKAHGLANASVREAVRQRFAAHGIGADRLELRGPTASAAEHLAAYGEADVALDTFPYNGTTTTCEALWMGVPVVTLAGASHAARVGASLLRRTGLDELVAADPRAYVARARELAADRARLAALRAGLRGRLEQSPLMDAPGCARDLERAYREAWRAWCAGRTISS